MRTYVRMLRGTCIYDNQHDSMQRPALLDCAASWTAARLSRRSCPENPPATGRRGASIGHPACLHCRWDAENLLNLHDFRFADPCLLHLVSAADDALEVPAEFPYRLRFHS